MKPHPRHRPPGMALRIGAWKRSFAAGIRNIYRMASKEPLVDVKRKIINTPDAPAAIGPYSQAIQIDEILYLSGQIGLDPQTGELVSDDVGDQTNQVLKNLKAVLLAAGTTEQNVIKTTVLLSDITNFSVMNEAYAQFFGENKPARAAFQAAALPKGAKVEIEGVAVVGNIIDVKK